MADGQPIQTIESATRSDTGAVILARDLLTMDEKTFTELRRATWPPTRRPDHPGPPLTFRCTLCEAPLSLTRLRRNGETKNRFFSHRHPADQNCPWLHRNRLRPDQIQAVDYFHLHEGEIHRRLKHFIADAMRRDSETDPETVIVDRFQIGKVLRGERKRPDVRAAWRGKPIVFEMQLSYTFISEVVKRDYFYANEGSFLIWVFYERRQDRAMVMDEEFFNRRNLFVLDAEAEAASIEAGHLMLNCHFVRPFLDEERRAIIDVPESRLVSLGDLVFPEGELRPYYIDCDAMRVPLLTRLEALEEADRQAELKKRELIEQEWRAQRASQEVREQAERAERVAQATIAPQLTTAVPGRDRLAPHSELSGGAAAAQIEPPRLVWEAVHDRATSARIGQRYMLTHRETNWRSVYSAAVEARSQGIEVSEMVTKAVEETKARPGDIRNFLIASRLARTK